MLCLLSKWPIWIQNEGRNFRSSEIVTLWKSYIPVTQDFGLGKTVIGPKTLGTTALKSVII